LCVCPSDYAGASIGSVTRDSSPTLSADFYVDPNAVPPVRPLRSQSFHTTGTFICLHNIPLIFVMHHSLLSLILHWEFVLITSRVHIHINNYYKLDHAEL